MNRPRKSSRSKAEAETAAAATAEEGGGGGDVPEKLPNGSSKQAGKRKRARSPAEPKPEPEPEYFAEKRSLEDLWQAAFPIGTEWENIDKLHEINWNFSNLEDAFEEEGALHGKTVYLFGCTEPQLLYFKGQQKIILIPIVVAVDSPIPPSEKIGIKSVQRESEEIVHMKKMKMAWIPYVPLEHRQSQVDRLKTQIYTLGCTQRRLALKHLKIERVKQYDYCLPYFQPLTADDEQEDTVVNILYPSDPPVVCDFDWELDDKEDFINDLVEKEVLTEDQKDGFKEFLTGEIKKRRQALKEAREARKKAIEDMDEKTRTAFQNMKVYKFYPVQTPDTPDTSAVKVAYVNRYYGKADFVM